jgi:hypothetical protein
MLGDGAHAQASRWSRRSLLTGTPPTLASLANGSREAMRDSLHGLRSLPPVALLRGCCAAGWRCRHGTGPRRNFAVVDVSAASCRPSRSRCRRETARSILGWPASPRHVERTGTRRGQSELSGPDSVEGRIVSDTASPTSARCPMSPTAHRSPLCV